MPTLQPQEVVRMAKPSSVAKFNTKRKRNTGV